MPLLGEGVMVAMYDVPAGWRYRHDDWHAHEHMLERVSIPGFLRGRRYVNDAASRRCFVMYEVDSLATQVSPPYLERLNNPTPWTRRVMPAMVDMCRTLTTVRRSVGDGIGGVMSVTEFDLGSLDAQGRDTRLATLAERLDGIDVRGGLLAAHLLVGDDDLSATPTEEKAIRGTQDDVADALLLIEAYEREALHGEIEILVDQAGWSEIPIVRTAEYRLAQLLAAPGTSASG